jgi:hypothetical protein
MTKTPPANSQLGSVGMTSRVTGGGLKHESAVASAVGINTAREYANWGGEFMDDAFRFGEQPFQVSDDRPGEIRRTEWGPLCATDSTMLP